MYWPRIRHLDALPAGRCHIYPHDEKCVRQYSAGHLGDFDALYEAYSSKLFTRWRRILAGEGQKHHPCGTCSDRCMLPVLPR